MEELHNLTDKEIKSLKDAVAIIKKFSNYIERVNVTNRCLQDNLDNAIKAGDVTNVQKVNLRIYERAERFGENLRKNLKAQCSPSCSCSQSEQAECAIAKAYWIADLLCQVANGEEMGWEEAFYRLLNKYDHEGYLNALRRGLLGNASCFHICREGSVIKLQGGRGA